MFFKVARHRVGLIVIEPQSQDDSCDPALGAPHDATLTEFLAYLATRAPETSGDERKFCPQDTADSTAVLAERFQLSRGTWLGAGRLSANVRSLAGELELALTHTRRAIAEAR